MHQLNPWGRGWRTKAACLCWLRLIPPPRRGGLGVPARRRGSLGLRGWTGPPVARPWSAGAVRQPRGTGLVGRVPWPKHGGHIRPPGWAGGCSAASQHPPQVQAVGPPPGRDGGSASPFSRLQSRSGVAAAPAVGPARQDPPGLLPSPKERALRAPPASGAAVALAGTPPGDHPTGEHRPLFYLSRVVFRSGAAASPGLMPLGGCLLGGDTPPPAWLSAAESCAALHKRGPATALRGCQGHAAGMRPRHGARLGVAHPGGGTRTHRLVGGEERGCWQRCGSPGSDSAVPWIANGAEMRDCGNSQFPTGREEGSPPPGLGSSCQRSRSRSPQQQGLGVGKPSPWPGGTWGALAAQLSHRHPARRKRGQQHPRRRPAVKHRCKTPRLHLAPCLSPRGWLWGARGSEGPPQGRPGLRRRGEQCRSIPSARWGHRRGVSLRAGRAHGVGLTTSAPRHGWLRGEAVLGQLGAITVPL